MSGPPDVLEQPDWELRCALTRPGFALDVDLRLPAQGVTVLFGPSGSGKTTLLRCMAGLERAAQGRLRWGDALWQDSAQGVFVPTWQRPLGYVFQEASLLEHLDVRGNLEYGLRHAPAPRRPALRAALQDSVCLLDLGALMQRRVHQLSGGERQRVALARALAMQPRLLLLDEPLSALGHVHKAEILAWLEHLRDSLRIPMVYVTHARDELARLADTVVVLSQGRVVAAGPVAQVMLQGHDALGGDDLAALLQGQVCAWDAQWQLAQVAFAGGSVWLPSAGLTLGQTVRLRVLARDVSLSTVQPQHTSIQNLLPCRVLSLDAPAGAQCVVRLLCASTVLLARITARAANQLGLAAGQQVWAQLKAVALVK